MRARCTDTKSASPIRGDGEIPLHKPLTRGCQHRNERPAALEDEASPRFCTMRRRIRGGEACLQEIQARFGDRVAAIVRGCSDAVTDDPKQKPPWRSRKERYIAHLLESSDDSVYLVSAADKLHNGACDAGRLSSARANGCGRNSIKTPARTEYLWYTTRLSPHTKNARIST